MAARSDTRWAKCLFDASPMTVSRATRRARRSCCARSEIARWYRGRAGGIPPRPADDGAFPDTTALLRHDRGDLAATLSSGCDGRVLIERQPGEVSNAERLDGQGSGPASAATWVSSESSSISPRSSSCGPIFPMCGPRLRTGTSDHPALDERGLSIRRTSSGKALPMSPD
jgi:hypothetical protein